MGKSFPQPIGEFPGRIVGFHQDGATRIFISDASYANKTPEEHARAKQHFLDVCAQVARDNAMRELRAHSGSV